MTRITVLPRNSGHTGHSRVASFAILAGLAVLAGRASLACSMTSDSQRALSAKKKHQRIEGTWGSGRACRSLGACFACFTLLSCLALRPRLALGTRRAWNWDRSGWLMNLNIHNHRFVLDLRRQLLNLCFNLGFSLFQQVIFLRSCCGLRRRRNTYIRAIGLNPLKMITRVPSGWQLGRWACRIQQVKTCARASDEPDPRDPSTSRQGYPAPAVVIRR